MHMGAFWAALGTAMIYATVAGAAPPLDTEQSAGEVRYVCTGIGETKDDPRWSRYPIKLMFAAPNGDLVTDVEVVVKNDAGGEVLRTACTGPWLLLDVPAGAYKVSASSGGKQVSGAFSVAGNRSGQMTLGLGFPG